QQMRLGQVIDVYVIADAGAVRRRVVGAEDFDGRALAHRGLNHQRDQVRLGVVVLADGTVRAGAGGVEVAQGGVAQVVSRGEIVQRSLDGQLGAPIRVDRPLRLVLGDRYFLRQAVGSASAGKNETLNAMSPDGVEQVDGIDEVVEVILGRL